MSDGPPLTPHPPALGLTAHGHVAELGHDITTLTGGIAGAGFPGRDTLTLLGARVAGCTHSTHAVAGTVAHSHGDARATDFNSQVAVLRNRADAAIVCSTLDRPLRKALNPRGLPEAVPRVRASAATVVGGARVSRSAWRKAQRLCLADVRAGVACWTSVPSRISAPIRGAHPLLVGERLDTDITDETLAGPPTQWGIASGNKHGGEQTHGRQHRKKILRHRIPLLSTTLADIRLKPVWSRVLKLSNSVLRRASR
jgi:hypothetical protein